MIREARFAIVVAVGLTLQLALTPALEAQSCRSMGGLAKQVFDHYVEQARDVGCDDWEACIRRADTAVRLMEQARTSFGWGTIGPRPLEFDETIEGHLVSESERTFISTGPIHGDAVDLQVRRLAFRGQARGTVCAVDRDGRMTEIDRFTIGPGNDSVYRTLRSVRERVLVLHFKGTKRLKQIRYGFGARIDEVAREPVDHATNQPGPDPREEADDATNRPGPAPEEDGDDEPTPLVVPPPTDVVILDPAGSDEETGPRAASDCVGYDPASLGVERRGGAWAVVEDGRHVLKTLATRQDARHAKRIARRHDRMCFVGRDNEREDRSRYVHSWFERDEGSGPASEDCIDYDERALRVVGEGAAGWLVTDGRSRLKVLATEADAERMASVMERHDRLCFLGRDNDRPDRRDYIMSYLKE